MASLLVEEGDRVQAGAVIADQLRLVNGSRIEERREAQAAADQADAALAQAVREHQRRVRAADVIPRDAARLRSRARWC